MNKTILKALILINPIVIWGIGNMLISFVMHTIMFSSMSVPFQDGGSDGFTIEYGVSPIYGIGFLIGGIYISIKLWIKYIENHE